MEDRTGKKWSREETMLAFELYCRTPFAKISKTNKDIINLAEYEYGSKYEGLVYEI